MAEARRCSQIAISKIESGRDEDLTIREIAAYAHASGERISVVFGKPLNHVEAVEAPMKTPEKVKSGPCTSMRGDFGWSNFTSRLPPNSL
jgi:hypothetical protein